MAAAAAKLKLGKRPGPSTADAPPPAKKQTSQFQPGESVLGNFKGLGDWDEALVVGVHGDGTYTLEYTDEGLVEEHVPASCVQRASGAAPPPSGPPPGLGPPPNPPPGLRPPGPPPGPPASAAFQPGDSVLGNFKGLGDWDEALVVGVHGDGTYTLEYTDEGLVEEHVPASRIMEAGGGDALSMAAQVEEAEAEPQAAGGMLAGGGLGALVVVEEGGVIEPPPDEATAEALAEKARQAEARAEARAKERAAARAAAAKAAAVAVKVEDTGGEEVANAVGVKKRAAVARTALALKQQEEESEYESEEDEDPDGDFFARKKWEGVRPGFCFKLGAEGMGYYKDVPFHVSYAAAEKAALKLSAPTLANWFYELLQAPPSVKKADRFYELFHLELLRVVGLGASHTAVNPPLFESLPHWFKCYRTMLATKASTSQLQVMQRVFLEPQQQVRLGLQHVTFSIDWVQVAGCASEPLQAGLLRKMGMADKRPKRMLMVVMFKAENNHITQMWADLDKEGLGSKKNLCLDDVLVSDAFDRLLAIARKNGAIGSLDPQFHNYHDVPLLNM